MARGQFHQLISPDCKDRIDVDENSAYASVRQAFKGRAEVVLAACVLDMEPQTERLRGCLYVPRIGFGVRIVWIYEKTDSLAGRDQHTQQLKSLRCESVCSQGDTSDITSWITGADGRCPRAATGHATAAPPSSDMNSRRLIR